MKNTQCCIHFYKNKEKMVGWGMKTGSLIEKDTIYFSALHAWHFIVKKNKKKNRCECWIYTLQWSDTIFIWCIKLSCSCGLAQLLVCLHYENITAKIWPEIICDSWDLLKEPLSLINTAFWLARSLRRQKALDQQKERETVDFLWQKL